MDKVKLARIVCEGSEYRTNALLELLGIEVEDKSEPTCMWCKDKECWNYMPDSKFACNGKCEAYEERKCPNLD